MTRDCPSIVWLILTPGTVGAAGWVLLPHSQGPSLPCFIPGDFVADLSSAGNCVLQERKQIPSRLCCAGKSWPVLLSRL